jgi:hypothetical protein
MVMLKECKCNELPKHTSACRTEGTRTIGRQRERWRGEVVGGLNIMGIKTGRRWAESVGNGGKYNWKPLSTMGRKV